MHMIDQVDAAHVAALNALGNDEKRFSWISPRACGSKFMQQYRNIQERLQQQQTTDAPNDSSQVVLADPAVAAWIYAQQKAHASLSETRKHYMAQLVGTPDWIEWKAPTGEED
jgi:hypothetical protein